MSYMLAISGGLKIEFKEISQTQAGKCVMVWSQNTDVWTGVCFDCISSTWQIYVMSCVKNKQASPKDLVQIDVRKNQNCWHQVRQNRQIKSVRKSFSFFFFVGRNPNKVERKILTSVVSLQISWAQQMDYCFRFINKGSKVLVHTLPNQ